MASVLGALNSVKKKARVSNRRRAVVLKGARVVGMEGISESVCQRQGSGGGTGVDQSEGIVGVPSHGSQVKVTGRRDIESAQVCPDPDMPCQAVSWSAFRPARWCPSAEKAVSRSIAP